MEEKPSKTQRKREMLALQSLGESLIELSDHQLSKLEMPDILRDAVQDARSMHKHGALTRQKQYIGKLMRNIDCEPIRMGLEKMQAAKQVQAQLFKRSEVWRDRILSEGNTAIEDFVQTFEQAERQPLAQWLRLANQENEYGKTTRSDKLLFQYINKILQDVM